MSLPYALRFFFLFLCKAGPSARLYKLYIPQLVTIANGSTNFQEILDALKNEPEVSYESDPTLD